MSRNLLFFMTHKKLLKHISVTELNVLDVFRTIILQLSYYKNISYPEKFRYPLVNKLFEQQNAHDLYKIHTFFNFILIPCFSGSTFLGSGFSRSRFFRGQVFQNPGFPVSTIFRVQVQVLEVALKIMF